MADIGREVEEFEVIPVELPNREPAVAPALPEPETVPALEPEPARA